MNGKVRVGFIPGSCHSISITKNMTVLDAIKQAHHISDRSAIDKVVKVNATYLNVPEARERTINPDEDLLIVLLPKTLFGEPPCFGGDCTKVKRQPQSYEETFYQLDDNCERCWDRHRKLAQDQEASILRRGDLEG